ncbi:MAG: ThuA domain-containing protein [Verrucomicrobiota bacterium]
MKITIWNEFVHERENEAVRELYPDGIHQTIAGFLSTQAGWKVGTATLDQPEHGLTEEVLAATDVLLWWGHMAHAKVSDEVAERVQRRVLEGMGFLPLHSAHYAKPFKLLLGTTCSLKWRDDGEKERLWNLMPGHPIAAGIGDFFELHEEMYGEPFGIPEPEELIFVSWFQGGEVFRSGCTWRRGHGKIFYFRPGHETFPSFHDDNVQRVITNGVKWAQPTVNILDDCPHADPLEPIAPAS